MKSRSSQEGLDIVVCARLTNLRELTTASSARSEQFRSFHLNPTDVLSLEDAFSGWVSDMICVFQPLT